MNLLIIDDDSICSFINTRVAATLGMFNEIRSVQNGKEGLEILENVSKGQGTAPDVILLDLNMPVMNGFDFIQALQKLAIAEEKRPDIVIVTSSDNAVDIERARALGIDHYLLKSITVKDLQSTFFSLYCKSKRK